MRIMRGLHNVRALSKGCVATIGNFDGVHLGHRGVLSRLVAQGQARGLPAVLVVFEPQPAEFFAGARAPTRLTRFRDKMRVLQTCGIDSVLCLRFDRALSQCDPEAFARRVLIDGLNVRYLMVGDDFRFGRERRGDFALLRHLGEACGFEVEQMPSLLVEGRRVSSTWVRERLWAGDFADVKRLLGRDFGIEGRVAHGEKLGRQLGCPTANIYLRHRPVPLWGVFAVQVSGMRLERTWQGVASVGTRPTVDGQEPVLEVHLLDYHGDLYGSHLRVIFLHKFRDQARYESLDALRRQIEMDISQARHFFKVIK
jgi:riboflavin kinase / FMN adenylyltransferase